ncbi:ADP-ribosylglycohydrolase family protein [Neolewinella maritima]|uniref:ADP-ribosylglycohydrolase family protein n=1 Tax=Neolewinella maritima TaxID=1383882 RepID=UPI001EE79080|nr:ADP-ribosylglycohydrolase family protein [Neolewinella maritima]
MPEPAAYLEADYQELALSDTVLYDKILGSLIGSAIGDAMGAPTEMWSQTDISEEYGYVDSLDLVLREPSPEGPWNYNLPPGAGTDDTRWKDLLVEYVVGEHHERPPATPLILDPGRFSAFLNTRYASSIAELKETSGLEPEPLEDAMRRVTWLQEWARITRAYAAGDIDGYRDALSGFYGGEMSCAGMLYAPVVGAAFPGRPDEAYEAAYGIALFDLGYARDLSGLTAALTSVAFLPTARPADFTRVLREVDPRGFFRSRLLGRIAYQQFKQARAIVRSARRVTVADARAMDLELPPAYTYDSLTYAQTRRAYELLAAARQDVPFHAGEVYLINLTALLFSNYQFQPAMEFVTNYGRDNDTVAAVTGAILGALHGYSGLPTPTRERVVRVNREVLAIDLEQRARALTDAVLSRRALDQEQ